MKVWMHISTTLLCILKEPINQNCLQIQALLTSLHETMQNYHGINWNKILKNHIYTCFPVVWFKAACLDIAQNNPTLPALQVNQITINDNQEKI